jgi:hypothetical protein
MYSFRNENVFLDCFLASEKCAKHMICFEIAAENWSIRNDIWRKVFMSIFGVIYSPYHIFWYWNGRRVPLYQYTRFLCFMRRDTKPRWSCWLDSSRFLQEIRNLDIWICLIFGSNFNNVFKVSGLIIETMCYIYLRICSGFRTKHYCVYWQNRFQANKNEKLEGRFQYYL